MAAFGEVGALRFAVFIGILVTMALLELVIPKRPLTYSKAKRWSTNVFFGAFASFAIKLMAILPLPLAAVAAAHYAQANGWGLFNMVTLTAVTIPLSFIQEGYSVTITPFVLELALSLMILDLAIYLQHWASHRIDMLWMFHKVHHSDVDIDVTTAVRFHPIEIMLSMLYKIVLVFLLGPMIVAIVVFEMILNGCAMFNHANVSLPKWLDSTVRLFIVTPDMHRIHHSKIREEHDSNYGFSISLWDRLFRTYTAQPSKGHDQMSIGLMDHQTPEPTKILWTLKFPFSGGK